MAILYGLACSNPACIHDSTPAYRMRMQLKRNDLCLNCGERGTQHAEFNAFTMRHETGWRVCRRCNQKWAEGFQNERRDLIFRVNQRDSALSYMASLGVKEPKEGNHVIEAPHPMIPVGFSARLIMFHAKKMPRTAIYFPMRPGQNEELTPDKAFQCVFAPGSTAAERRTAPQFPVPEEQLKASLNVADASGLVQSYSDIKCQHCMQRIPLRDYNLTSLMEVELGD